MANEGKPQIDGDMCSHLLEIGKSIWRCKCKICAKRRIHFYGKPAISHKFSRQQMCRSAVTRNSGFAIFMLKNWSSYLGVVHWQPVGVDASLLLELTLKRIGNVLCGEKMKETKFNFPFQETIRWQGNSPGGQRHKPLSRESSCSACWRLRRSVSSSSSRTVPPPDCWQILNVTKIIKYIILA